MAIRHVVRQRKENRRCVLVQVLSENGINVVELVMVMKHGLN
jgi:hypothetical protein